jgi:hypothetical protein
MEEPPVERFEPLDGTHAAAGPLRRLVLASGRSVVVAADRPVPGVLLRGGAAIVHPDCCRVRLGDRVAFRLRNNRRTLDRSADELLASEGWSTERIGVARRAAAELKQRLSTTLNSCGAQWLIDTLHKAGLDRAYARYLTEAPLREHYLAPRRKAAFQALVTATSARMTASAETLGGAPLDVAFRDLCTLRRAQQRAGERLWAQLADWLCGQSGTALTHPYLGDVLVETVIGFDDEPTDDRSGCLLSPDGRRMARLPSTIARGTHDAA